MSNKLTSFRKRRNQKKSDYSDIPDYYAQYNSRNQIITREDVEKLFDNFGLKGIKPITIDYYIEALTHNSYAVNKTKYDFLTIEEVKMKNINRKNIDRDIKNGLIAEFRRNNYERLEHLGDAVIYDATTEYLFERYPYVNEDFLSKMRKEIVKGKSLAKLARIIELDRFVLLSSHIEIINGRSNDNILENIMEAFVGAIRKDFKQKDKYLGIKYSFDFFTNIIEKCLDMTQIIISENDYKLLLIKHFQKMGWDNPVFYTMQESGPDHRREFLRAVNDKDGNVMSKASGNSSKEADQLCAKKALIKLKLITVVDTSNYIF